MSLSFQSRVILTFATLFTCVLLAVFISVWHATRDNFHRQVDLQLDYTTTALQRQIDVRLGTLQRETAVLARDFGFRAAVSSGDINTLKSAMGNFIRRIRVDRLLVLSPNGSLVADSAGSQYDSDAVFLPVAGEQPFTHVVHQGDKAIFYAVMPVMAPDLVGWIAGGLHAGDLLAEELRTLLPGTPDISFYIESFNGTQLLGSTLPVAMRKPLTAAINALDTDLPLLQLSGNSYKFRHHVLETLQDNSKLVASMQLSLNEAQAWLKQLAFWFMLACSLGLLLVFGGAWLMARNLSRPVRHLVRAAESIRGGNYDVNLPVNRQDEFGLLSDSFLQMTKGIREREQCIREQAMHDSLTGLPNRIYLEQRLKTELDSRQQTNSPLTLVLLSLDRLAEVNYILGHDIADRVVINVGQRLLKTVRPDDQVARIGTDTFGIVMPGISGVDASRAVTRFMVLFEQPVEVDTLPIDISAHAGISHYPEHTRDARELLRAAEHALFVAHSSHERMASYDPARDSTSRLHLSLMGDLRNAIADNELELWYQPQTGTDGSFAHAEALVRWQHPVHGMIPPDRFIQLAERTGEIQRLTNWVLEAALHQQADWRARGLPLQLSVNLSACDLANRQLPTHIQELLQRFGTHPQDLCVEITESAVMGDPDSVMSVLHTLRASGIRIAIDDFGTGYSSLEYLSKLPVDELKIDRAFVYGMVEDADKQLIVRSAIELAHGLGLGVVAEGVESEQEAQLLRELGCELLQGFGISRPLPPADLERWADTRRTGKPAPADTSVTYLEEKSRG